MLVSEEEIFCSPDEEELIQNGCLKTLDTPEGRFSIESILERLPPGKEPELVVIKTDASGRLMPTGLERLSCPKVLILGDTHHLPAPISFLIEYAKSERFDIILSDHDRHHLHFFKRSGFSNIYWIPGLNYNLRPRPLCMDVEKKAIFVGQTGAYHPYRRALFEKAKDLDLPLEVCTAPSEIAATLYSRNAISLNCSLNGDLNLRVFEILGSGGLLLTDRISEDSGLYRIFEEGKDILSYTSLGELREKIIYYLEHEEERLAIRQAGYDKLRANHTPASKRRQLMDLAFNSKVEPELMLDDTRFVSLANKDAGNIMEDVTLYQFIQDEHRRSSHVIFYTDASGGVELYYVKDLPRLEFRNLDCCDEDFSNENELNLPEARFLACADANEIRIRLESFVGRYIVLLGSSGQDEELLSRISHAGFIASENLPNLFVLNNPLLAAKRWLEAGKYAAVAHLLETLDVDRLPLETVCQAAEWAIAVKRFDLSKRFLSICLSIDRSLTIAYLGVVEALIRLGDSPEEAYMHLWEAQRFEPIGEDGEALLQELEATLDTSSRRLKTYLDSIGMNPTCRRLDRSTRILVLTNLFPPQELGGYGRKMWEFTRELRRRGHVVKILSADVPSLLSEANEEVAALDEHVERRLRLFGEWPSGLARINSSQDEILRVTNENHRIVKEMINAFEPDFCLMGNIDFVGYLVVEALTEASIPIVHCIGNPTPGLPKDYRPSASLYCSGPASAFLSKVLSNDGYPVNRPEVLYPGARIDDFIRLKDPAFDVPRIAFASILMPYKGADTLVDALILLHENGIHFQATLAGYASDNDYLDTLKNKARSSGLGESIVFPGLLDRKELIRLFARSNILVFPSIVDEAFGITQVEGMASGLAVVTSATGGAAEVVRDGVDGLHFKKGDARDLAMKIASLVADPEAWARYAKTGQERSKQFSVSATVDTIEEMFEEMQVSALA